MVRISDIQDGQVIWDSVPYCNIPENDIDTYLLKKNDILFARTGGTVGKSYLVQDVPEESIYAGYLIRTRYSASLCPQYLKHFMESPLYWDQLKEGTTATAQPNCNGKTLGKMLIPIPPKEEQQRIVKKFEEIEPLVQQFGSAYEYSQKLNIVFPEQLKKSILQLAVQGKLVPQDPNDEPASVLLERIRAEKERLIKEGKIKRDKNESIIFRRDNSHYEKLGLEERCIDDEIPFEIPDSWVWSRVGSLFSLQAGKNIPASEIKESVFEGSYPCFGGNGLRGHVSFYNHEGDYPLIGRQGALCGNINRATGRFYATEHAVCVERFADTNISWACLFLKALNLNQYATATAQPGLAVTNINKVLIPLPPLGEQQRITARAEALLTIIKSL